MKETGVSATKERLASSWLALNTIYNIWLGLNFNSTSKEEEPVLKDEVISNFRFFVNTLAENEPKLKLFETFFKRKLSYFSYEVERCEKLSENITSTIELALLLACILGQHYPISMILIIRKNAAYYYPHDHSFFKDDLDQVVARVQKKYGKIVSQVTPQVKT